MDYFLGFDEIVNDILSSLLELVPSINLLNRNLPVHQIDLLFELLALFGGVFTDDIPIKLVYVPNFIDFSR